MTEITIVQRIAWMDTDAAGIYHYTTVFRLAEAAETALHTESGIERITYGATPRVSVSFEFVRPVAFNDDVTVRLVVVAMGKTSVTYEIELAHHEQLVAKGRIVGVFIDRATRRPQSWPDSVRAALCPQSHAA
jgi:acyl-CoA thioester hydrolase